MNLLEFNKRFPDEESCVIYLKELRLQKGIKCGNCNTVTKHWWLDKIQKFQCSQCDSRTNLKSGTMMYKSKVTLHTWFMCIHFMTTSKKPFSCLEMQRQLGIKRYQTMWDMMRKIRIMMGKRDDLYTLDGIVEVDEGHFVVVDPIEYDELGNKIDRYKTLTKGQGSERMSKVLVSVESRPVENPSTKKNKKERVMGYVKMEVIENCKSVTINSTIEEIIDKDSHLLTDGATWYKNVKKVVKGHTPMIVKPKEAGKKLPWVHTVISNCKRQLLGVHHSVQREFLQLYLNEFCYKLNRRNFKYRDSFDGMVVASLDGSTLD